ncbi:MAG: peptidoglycan-binding protein [Ilumatobacteraceae bacterium]|nr:peptidoglycan-binding protein [Ilumatobacteraceae bacterium]
MRRRPLVRRVAVLAALTSGALVGVAVAADGIDGAAETPTQAAIRLDPPDRAVVIGDSAIAALRWVPGADNAIVGFGHTLDLESCRRLFLSSCIGREQRRPPTLYDAMDFHAGKYGTLVVATGYNDGPEAFDASFRAVVDKARLQGFDRIVWFTLRSDVDYVSPGSVGNHEVFAENNASLHDLLATGDFPDVVLADWGGYTAELSHWFVTDGVHYRQIGAWGASDYLSRKMAFLDGRACPFAVDPSREPENPCPDPDVTGPVADIEALYPIGEDGVLCYEIGDDRTIECRSDTHVIQLTRVLQLGDHGDDVEALQTRLVRLGLLTVGADGSFGPSTRSAVESFQQSNGLTISGVADVATLDTLGFDTSAVSG